MLADLVARRAAGHLRAPVTAAPREAVDPVCGMTVFEDQAKYHIVHDGADYSFSARPATAHVPGQSSRVRGVGRATGFLNRVRRFESSRGRPSSDQAKHAKGLVASLFAGLGVTARAPGPSATGARLQ